MSQQNYQLQLEALKALEACIHGINRDVDNMMRGYRNQVQGLLDQGLTMQVHDKFLHEFFMPAQNLTSQFHVINENAISYVRGQEAGIQQLMER